MCSICSSNTSVTCHFSLVPISNNHRHWKVFKWISWWLVALLLFVSWFSYWLEVFLYRLYACTSYWICVQVIGRLNFDCKFLKTSVMKSSVMHAHHNNNKKCLKIILEVMQCTLAVVKWWKLRKLTFFRSQRTA